MAGLRMAAGGEGGVWGWTGRVRRGERGEAEADLGTGGRQRRAPAGPPGVRGPEVVGPRPG